MLKMTCIEYHQIVRGKNIIKWVLELSNLFLRMKYTVSLTFIQRGLLELPFNGKDKLCYCKKACHN